MENTPPVNNLFCTNCGNAVSEQAVACMSCGARPTGHKKFCRHCAALLNPEQVVCVKCGAAVKTTFSGVANPLAGINTGSMTVGDITILAAAALALISFFLSWIEITMPLVGKISSNGFAIYAFWLGGAFIYPVWTTLAGLLGKSASINKVIGFACAVLGFVGGLAHVSWAKTNAVSSTLASFQKMGLGEPPRGMEQEIANGLFVSGAGVYLFLCACIVLGIGIALTTRTSATRNSSDTLSPSQRGRKSELNLYFHLFWICMVATVSLSLVHFAMPRLVPEVAFSRSQFLQLAIWNMSFNYHGIGWYGYGTSATRNAEIAIAGSSEEIAWAKNVIAFTKWWPITWYSTLLAMIACTVSLCMLLYRLWKRIPNEIARTTPCKAVGLLFIPLFNLYWAFVAFKGLSVDMNETLRRRGIQHQISKGLGSWLSIVWLVFWICFGFATFLFMSLERLFRPDFLGECVLITSLGFFIVCFLSFLALAVVAIFFFKSVKNGAIALLEREGQ